MTNEEAIKTLKDMISIPVWDIKNADAVERAIKSLEQEPCEDCISREAVNTLVDELARAISDERCCMSRGRSTETIMQDILELPPVIPQPKIGHWIKHNIDGGAYYDCSLCACIAPYTETADTILWKLSNYCPDCGTKMEEEE